MLKISAAFGRKTPVNGEQFSSQSFHSAVEFELSDAASVEQIRDRIAEAHRLVRSSVERELNGSSPVTTEVSPGRPGDIHAVPLTHKQAGFLLFMAKQNGLTPVQLDERIAKELGVDGGLRAISKSQASELIAKLKSQVAA